MPTRASCHSSRSRVLGATSVPMQLASRRRRAAGSRGASVARGALVVQAALPGLPGARLPRQLGRFAPQPRRLRLDLLHDARRRPRARGVGVLLEAVAARAAATRADGGPRRAAQAIAWYWHFVNVATVVVTGPPLGADMTIRRLAVLQWFGLLAGAAAWAAQLVHRLGSPRPPAAPTATLGHRERRLAGGADGCRRGGACSRAEAAARRRAAADARRRATSTIPARRASASSPSPPPSANAAVPRHRPARRRRRHRRRRLPPGMGRRDRRLLLAALAPPARGFGARPATSRRRRAPLRPLLRRLPRRRRGVAGRSRSARPAARPGAAAGSGRRCAASGALAADFYLRTGYMPLAAPAISRAARACCFGEAEIRRSCVRRLARRRAVDPAPHPEHGDLPRARTSSPTAAPAATRSSRRAATSPAPCRRAAAPPPTQIAEAVRIGPYVMPRFSRAAISDRELDSIIAYVQYAKQPDDRGGWQSATSDRCRRGS